MAGRRALLGAAEATAWAEQQQQPSAAGVQTLDWVATVPMRGRSAVAEPRWRAAEVQVQVQEGPWASSVAARACVQFARPEVQARWARRALWAAAAGARAVESVHDGLGANRGRTLHPCCIWPSRP